ncbi:MAG: pilus assembly protein TadC [Bdellovibrio sp.]|nr:MAG: pilus assembly protein TadC [Bdellovibrio sp.]
MLNTDLVMIAALALTGVSVYFLSAALLTNNTDRELLSWASGTEPERSRSALINWSRPLVHQFTLQHAARIKNERFRRNIEHLIMTAGLSRELNVDEFIGLKLFWGVGFVGLLALLNFAFHVGIPLWMFALAIPVGWQFPDMYAKNQRKSRQISVRADLPFFTDLLALSTEAGLDFISAIQRIVDKAEGSVLGDELAIVLKDIKLGSARADALRGLAKRIDIPETTSFVAVLVDADATGASIAQVLKDQSEQIRLERFVRAEKAGARASQLMLIPLIFFILPAVFIVVFGPVAVNFISGGAK